MFFLKEVFITSDEQEFVKVKSFFDLNKLKYKSKVETEDYRLAINRIPRYGFVSKKPVTLYKIYVFYKQVDFAKYLISKVLV